MKLLFKISTIDHLAFYPGDPDPSQVLIVRSRLTPPLADDLDCRVQCYSELGVPLRNFENLPLTLSMQGAEVTIGVNTWLCTIAHKFRIVRPKGAKENDISLDLMMRLHFDGAVHLVDLCRQLNKSEFEMSIRPPDGWSVQQSLPLREAEPDDDGDDDEEEAPPLLADEIDNGCVDCANLIPLVPLSNPPQHASGQPCTAIMPVTVPGESTLAPAVVASGGTHQRRRRE